MVLVSYIREKQYMPTQWALSPLAFLSVTFIYVAHMFIYIGISFQLPLVLDINHFIHDNLRDFTID